MSFLSQLGLAQAARRLAVGDMACQEALGKGRVGLIVLARDASHRTKRRFVFLAERHSVPCVEMASKAELGQALGRRDVAVIGVCDQGFSRSIQAALAHGTGQ